MATAALAREAAGMATADACSDCRVTRQGLERRTPPGQLLTARCGHSAVCEECLPTKFEILNQSSRGRLTCKTCAAELRESDFSSKSPEELLVEQALQIRRKVKKECVADCMRTKPTMAVRLRTHPRGRVAA